MFLVYELSKFSNWELLSTKNQVAQSEIRIYYYTEEIFKKMFKIVNSRTYRVPPCFC